MILIVGYTTHYPYGEFQDEPSAERALDEVNKKFMEFGSTVPFGIQQRLPFSLGEIWFLGRVMPRAKEKGPDGLPPTRA